MIFYQFLRRMKHKAGIIELSSFLATGLLEIWKKNHFLFIPLDF